MSLSAPIPDEEIVKAMAALDVQARRRMPTSVDGFISYPEQSPDEKAEHFLTDLGYMIAVVQVDIGDVRDQLDKLLR